MLNNKTLIPVRNNNDLYDPLGELIPIVSQHIDIYDEFSSLIPKSNLNSVYNYKEQLIPIAKKQQKNEYKTSLQKTEVSYDRSYISQINNKTVSKDAIYGKPDINTYSNKVAEYSFEKNLIPYIKNIDEYDEKQNLIPITKHPSITARKKHGLIDMKPWLASLKGILDLPPILNALAPDFLLPPQFGMIAKQVQGLLANPTPINLAFTMLELPFLIMQRIRGKYQWLLIQEGVKTLARYSGLPIDRFIFIADYGKNKVTDLGKYDINTYSPFSIPEIKNRIEDASFLGQQTTEEYVPTTLLSTTKNAKNSNNSIDTIKRKYQQYQEAFEKSTLEYVKSRNQKFSKSVYAKKNETELGDYFQQIKNPVGFAFRTSSPNRSLSSSILQYGIDKDISNRVTIVDPLSYQIQSYRTPVFRGVTGPAESIAGSDKDINSNFKGNLIKFWIRNLNDDSVMTTPAFISELQDSGGNGTWDQVSYVNAYYPQFIYKGAEKRTITFTLKLACFDKTYLPQYVEKLNFLRTVGFPYYKDVEIPRTNKLGQESNDASVSTLKVSLAKAPVFALTLGDIINQQKGYFQACDFTWEDEQTTWNLNPKRMFRTQNITGGDNVLNNLEELTNNTAHDSEWELPIVTTITCTFVCMYGRGPSSNYKDDDHYIYDTENLKTARKDLERTNENLSNNAMNGVTT